jgi:hypothetical protein
MADYYPLIARAIAGLDPSAPGESRRALYERARAALIAQLRGVQPPLSESEITRERLSLEEAVRKVESEAAQRAREISRGGGGANPGASSPGGGRAGDAFRANTRPATRPGEPAPPPSAPQSPPSQPSAAPPPAGLRPRPSSPPPSRNDRPPLGQEDPRQQPRNLRPDGAPSPRSQPQVPMQDPQLPPTRERTGSPRRGSDNTPPQAPPPGMRGFRDIAADVDDLGRATTQANRAARKTYANVPSPEFDRLEHGEENRGADPDAPYSYDESIEEAERYTPSPQAPAPRSRLSQDRDRPPKRVSGGTAFPFKSAIAVGVVLILVGAAILWGKSVVTTVSGLFKPSATVVEAPKDTSPLSKPKIPDRVGQPSSTDQVAPVAQRVVLYDEDPSDPKGKQYVGTVVWRTEPVKAAAGQPADIAVRADIEIPDRKFKMTMSFRRNTDTSLPASHTAELTFILPPDFAGGGVANVPGILMKSNEQARGTPLAGLAVKVTDGFFLVGLSNVDADRSRNIQLLKERSWFDVPLVYANQRRAIIAIEKGPPGERAFADAFAAWGE